MNSLTFDRLKELPDSPGVYFIWKDGVCVYVGCSGKLRTRLRGHHVRSQFPWCEKVEWLETSTREESLSLEEKFIEELTPIWNWNTGQFSKHKTLSLSADDQKVILKIQRHLKQSEGHVTAAQVVRRALRLFATAYKIDLKKGE